MDADAILLDITRMLAEVIGEDYLLDIDITMDTSFSVDLEIESIEFVALAGLMKEHYRGQVDFVAFMAGMGVREIMGLTVGQVVGHIEGSLLVGVDHG